VKTVVRQALETAIVRILTPTRSTDILREAMAAKQQGRSVGRRMMMMVMMMMIVVVMGVMSGGEEDGDAVSMMRMSKEARIDTAMMIMMKASTE
jgi:hypothetical protein